MKKQACLKGSLSKGTKRTEILNTLVSLLKWGLSFKT